MTALQAAFVACLVSLVLGFGVGWYAKGKFDQAAQVKAAADAVTAANKAADQRVAVEKKVADATSQQLATEQGKTADLNQQLSGLRATNASLSDQIAHVQFSRVSKPTVAASCPTGSAIGSAEFMQLYNAAATQSGTTGTARGNTHTSRMYESRVPGIFERPDDAAGELRDHVRRWSVPNDFGEQEHRRRELQSAA